MKQRRKSLVLTVLVVTALVVGLVPALPVFAATQVLGGGAVEGELRVYVLDNTPTPASSGVYGIQRYASGVWQNQVFATYAKDSRLYANGTGYGFGAYYATGARYTALSNVLSGDTATTAWGAQGGISVTQIVTYTPGTTYVLYTWRITNISSAAISDLRFFHGQDTYLAGGDLGAGFWDAANNTIGVQKLVGGTLQRLVLQGQTTPYAYESRNYSQVRSGVRSNALTNTLDPNPTVDNGYALEWRTGSLDPGQSWEINAVERFSSYASGTTVVLAPTFTDCRVSQSCNLVFSVQNLDTIPVTVTLAVSNTQTTWPTSIVAPGGTPTISPGSTIPVTVSVSIPGGTADGMLGNVTLTATPEGGGTPGSDTGTVRAVLPGATIVKTAEDLNGAPLRTGDLIRYTVSVTNTSSTITMTNVLVTDTLPSGVAFVSATPPGYGGPNPLTWSVSNLVTGTMWSAVITIQVDSGVSSIGGNVAQVSSDEVDLLQTEPIYPPGGGNVQPYILTINTAGTGSGNVTANPPGPAYAAGTVVTLTATPLISSTFVGWTGDVVTTTNPVVLTMDADKSVTTTFTLNTYNLTLATAGNGSGTVSNTPSGTTFEYGTVVTVTATPNTGSSFTSWSPNCTVVGSDCVVTISADTLVTATFTLNTHNLTLNTVGSGTVSKNPDQATYNYGDVITLTATPAPGWSFGAWSGDLVSTTNPAAITIDGNKVITATFTQNAYTLAVNTVGNGTVAKNPDQATYNYGDVITLTATPAPGWSFGAWSGDLVSTTNPAAITIDGNKVITATFTQNAYTLAVNTVGSGTVAKNPDQATYNYGDVITLTATPAPGWSFGAWSGDVTGSTNPITITIDGNKVVTATFTLNEYTLSTNTVGSGSVTRNPNQATYPFGTVVTVTAVPATNWAFVNWSGDLSGSVNPTTITIDGNKVVTATFSSTCSSVTGADFTFSPTVPRVGQSVNFTATVAGGTAPITYMWNFGHGADVVTTAAVTAHSFPLTTTMQTYNVSLTAANACTASPVPVVKQVMVWPYFINLPLIMR